MRFVANGWISEVYVEPTYHFSYAGFAWVQPWPAWGMYVHFALLGLASLGVALGYRYRWSIIAFFLLFTYVELIDQTTYLNHYYLVSLLSLVMAFLPMARVASLDSRKTPADVHPVVPRATLWVLRAQLGLVYVFAGLAKLNPDWLFDAQPLTIWLYNSADAHLIGAFVREQWVAYAMSWAGAFFDLTIVGWLLWLGSRPYAYGVLVLFHMATALLFPAIGMFPWIMIGTALIFFDSDWPARVASRLRVLHRLPPGPTLFGRAASHGCPLTWPVRVALVLAAPVLRSTSARAPATLGLRWRRAMDGRGLSLLVEGASDGEDRTRAFPHEKLCHRRRAPHLPGRIPDANTGRAHGIPARLGAGNGPHHPR